MAAVPRRLPISLGQVRFILTIFRLEVQPTSLLPSSYYPRGMFLASKPFI